MKTLFALLFACVALSAQNSAPWQPQYFIGTGVTYDYYGTSGFAANTELGLLVKPPMYSYSTIELTRTVATLRTGAAWMFLQQGRWIGLALGDGGLATGSGVTLGSFSGGGILGYDVGGRLTKDTSHFYVGGALRIISTGGQTVQPIFSLILGKAF